MITYRIAYTHGIQNVSLYRSHELSLSLTSPGRLLLGKRYNAIDGLLILSADDAPKRQVYECISHPSRGPVQGTCLLYLWVIVQHCFPILLSSIRMKVLSWHTEYIP